MPSTLMMSAIFKTASRAVQRAAMAELTSTGFGQLYRQTQDILRSPSRLRSKFARMARRARPPSGSEILRELTGTDYRSLVREVAKYGKMPNMAGGLVNQFLDALGPVGTILKALASSGRAAEPSLEAMADVLRSHGYTVIPPERAPARTQRLPQLALREGGLRAPSRTMVDLPMSTGTYRRFRRTHPIVSGEMVRAPNSTNVHSFAYQMDTAALYVRFWAGAGEGRHAGPMYQYGNVEPEVFLQLYRVRNQGGKEAPGVKSPGTFVWDKLRIVGTVSGHQYDYKLVGIAQGYVPRKATYREGEEWYMPRRFRNVEGQWHRSQLAPSRAAVPDRGQPDRGLPDTGAP